MAEKWMQRAFGKHPGALHKAMGVAKGKKIPIDRLRAFRSRLQKRVKAGKATKKQGKILRRANLAWRVKAGDLKR